MNLRAHEVVNGVVRGKEKHLSVMQHEGFLFRLSSYFFLLMNYWIISPAQTQSGRRVLFWKCLSAFFMPISSFYKRYPHCNLKGQFIPNQKYILFLLPVVLFINLDSFGVSCLVLEISAVEISALSQIQWE